MKHWWVVYKVNPEESEVIATQQEALEEPDDEAAQQEAPEGPEVEDKADDQPWVKYRLVEF
jgi:hypothetical protein